MNLIEYNLEKIKIKKWAMKNSLKNSIIFDEFVTWKMIKAI